MIRWNLCEGGNVVNSFGNECWKADISYEAVLSRGLRKWTRNCRVETPYLPPRLPLPLGALLPFLEGFEGGA